MKTRSNTRTWYKARETHVTKSWSVLVLQVIGWVRHATFINQSQNYLDYFRHSVKPLHATELLSVNEDMQDKNHKKIARPGKVQFI